MSPSEIAISVTKVIDTSPGEHPAMGGADHLSVRTLTTISELENIREAWELLPGYRDSDPDLVFAILRSRPEILRPHVIVVERNHVITTMLVGRLEQTSLDLTIGYVHCRPRARLIYFFHGGVRGEETLEVCQLLIEEIRTCLASGEADLAYLNYLRVDTLLYKSAGNRSYFTGPDNPATTQDHFVARLPGSLDEFYANLSANARAQARSKARKIERAFPGTAQIRCYRSVTELSRLTDDAESIMRNSYQRGLDVGFRDSAVTRELLHMKAEKKRLRGHILYLGNIPAAFWIGELNRGEFISDFVAYDSQFSNYSPGIYLILKVIEGYYSGCEGKVSVVDFTLGSARYKESLSNDKWQEAPIYIYAPTFKGLELKLARLIVLAIDSALKSLLIKTGVLQKVKKWWRDAAVKNTKS